MVRENCAAELEQEVARLVKQGMKWLVLDLRSDLAGRGRRDLREGDVMTAYALELRRQGTVRARGYEVARYIFGPGAERRRRAPCSDWQERRSPGLTDPPPGHRTARRT